MLLKPAQVAIIILAFATYTLEPIHDSCRSSDAPVKCLAALAVCKFYALADPRGCPSTGPLRVPIPSF